mgnify:CR=1 FL=1
MKLIITIFLIFTVLADFTSASFHNDGIDSCESQISCVEADLHSSSDRDHNEGEDHHDHCHLGHSHNLITSSNNIEFYPRFQKITIMYPLLKVGSIKNYFLDIIRPPIA